MTTPLTCTWSGVFPAATTQFDAAIGSRSAGDAKSAKGAARGRRARPRVDGHGGRGQFLDRGGEAQCAARPPSRSPSGKVPVIAGVSEFTTATAARFARDAERLGAAGLMVLPAMVYVPTAAELEHHFRTVAAASGLPIMLYNNPPSYRVNIDIATLGRLADVPNIVAHQGVRTRFAPLHRHHQRLRRALRAVRGPRRCRLRGADARRQGLGIGPHQRVSGRIAAASTTRCAQAISIRRARSTAGSCRCCTWMRSTIWCNPSSSPNRSWAAVPSACACRGCRLSGERRAAVIAMIERARDTRPRYAESGS